MAMKKLSDKKVNKDAAGLFLPSYDSDGQPISDGNNAGVQRDITLYTFLRTAAEKLSKLEDGESDTKKKVRLYEIATDNLEKHSKYGGKMTDFVDVKDTRGKTIRLTHVAIQQRLEKFKPSL